MRKLFLLGGLALSVLAAPAFAQQVTTNGSLSGRVTDPSGAVVPGAEVTARQTETNQTSATQTDRDGRFRFPSLRVGPYQVVVHLQGFDEATFCGITATPLLWIVGTIFYWRETPTERAQRLARAGADTLTCPNCGYNLTGLREARCTECGAGFTLNDLLAAQPNRAAAEIEQ